MYTDIFIVRRDCVFRNFRIFSFLEKAIFSLLSSRKDVHFFVFVTQKRYGNVAFSDYGNVRKFPKYHLFVYFCVFSPCEMIGFCAVKNLRDFIKNVCIILMDIWKQSNWMKSLAIYRKILSHDTTSFLLLF